MFDFWSISVTVCFISYRYNFADLSSSGMLCCKLACIVLHDLVTGYDFLLLCTLSWILNFRQHWASRVGIFMIKHNALFVCGWWCDYFLHRHYEQPRTVIYSWERNVRECIMCTSINIGVHYVYVYVYLIPLYIYIKT